MSKKLCKARKKRPVENCLFVNEFNESLRKFKTEDIIARSIVMIFIEPLIETLSNALIECIKKGNFQQLLSDLRQACLETDREFKLPLAPRYKGKRPKGKRFR